MKKNETTSNFKAKLLRPANSSSDGSWAFVILPKVASNKLPRRGRTTVLGKINGHEFQVTLEPDGKKSHWLQVNQELLESSNCNIGDMVEFEITPAATEPEPKIPADFQNALSKAPEAQMVWNETTTLSRVDWIHWITTAKQVKTRAKRINDACDMLASGKRRVCCFDVSGFYSKALSAPKAE